MICYKLNKGFSKCDSSYQFRWIQRVVLINKSDVNAVQRSGNAISFSLNASTKGYAFESLDRMGQVLGNYETVTKNNYKQYRHNVQMTLSGLGFDTSSINNGEYFAALLTSDGRVFIFGFDYLLEPEDYLFESQKLNSITLRSTESGLEDNIPLLFISDDPAKDFYENFENSEAQPILGEFNDDFSEDFNI